MQKRLLGLLLVATLIILSLGAITVSDEFLQTGVTEVPETADKEEPTLSVQPLTVEDAFLVVRTKTAPKDGQYLQFLNYPVPVDIYSILYLNDNQTSFIVLYYEGLNEAGDCYRFVLASALKDGDVVRQQVSNRYAVNKYSGELYQLYIVDGDILGEVDPDWPG